MIILTGDVHHMSMQTHDQKLLRGLSELEVTEEYLKIANSHGIIPLLFLTGRLAIEEAGLLKRLNNSYKFDVGGHTYYGNSGLYRKYYYGAFKRVFNLANGSKKNQKQDVWKTIEIYKKYLSRDIISWRNHAYRTDRNTNYILSELGVKLVSNRVVDSDIGPNFISKELLEIPINTMPDHEHLYHSKLNTKPKISVKIWVEKIKQEILLQKTLKVDSVVLAHPACMYIEDNFSQFEELCKFLASNEVATLQNFCEKYV